MAIPRRGHARGRPEGRDWWDKASIISGFFSSIVIALMGILISYSIQSAQLISTQKNNDAQIAAANLKAQDDKKLQEGQLTAQLVQHLVSKQAAQREIAVVALRESVPPDVCDKIIAILARSDESPNVRARAIEELGSSTAAGAARTLAEITHDERRSTSERSLAASSSIQIAARQAADVSSPTGATLLLASTGAAGMALDSSPFTEILLKGMMGDADISGDRAVSGSELGRYVASMFPIRMQRFPEPKQQPIWATKGNDDPVMGPLATLHTRYHSVFALVIGVSSDSGGSIHRGVQADVRQFAEAMQRAGVSTTALMDSAATKLAVQGAFARAEASLGSEDLFIFYLTGNASISPQGAVQWWLAGGPSESLTAAEINTALDKIRAKSKAVFVNSCYAGAIAQQTASR